MPVALSLHIVEVALQMEGASMSAGGQPLPSDLGNELAELDDDSAHFLDVVLSHRLGGTRQGGYT